MGERDRMEQDRQRGLRRAAVGLWFAIERMRRGSAGGPPDPGDDDDSDNGAGAGVPRRPAPEGGAATAAAGAPEVERDETPH